MLKQLRALFTKRHTSVFRRSRWAGLTDAHRNWIRAFVGVIGVVMLVWLFPRESMTEFSGWRAGMVAPREVIAPFTFNVRTGDIELENARARARVSVAPAVRALPEVVVEQERRLTEFLRVSAQFARQPATAIPDTAFPLPQELIHQSTLHWLTRDANVAMARTLTLPVLRRIFEQGVTSVDDAGQLRDYFDRRQALLGADTPPEQVMLINDSGTEQLVAFSRIESTEEVRDNVGQIITSRALSAGIQVSSEALRALHNIVTSAVVPNRMYDRNETIRRQTQAAANVALYKRTIFKDERFVASHQVLTNDDIDELRSLMEALQERQRQTARWQESVQWIGRVAIVTMVLLILAAYIRQFERRVWRRPEWLFLCVLLVWLPLTVAGYVAANVAVSAYVIPLALTAMLGTVLFGPQIGFALSAATLLIGGVLLGFDFHVVFVNAIASTVAVFSVQHVRNRNQFLRAMIYLPLAIIVTIVSSDIIQGTTGSAMLGHLWPGVVSGLAVPVLSMGLLVVFEKVFSITTNITLLELSDLNSPLLRELAIQAPGTYTHSLIIANLTESAAEAVGANPLLARVGAYYHDLGKMERPDHFVENQLYKGNPHDKLSPQMSALIVVSHVKNGIEIAKEAGLPKQIIDFIPQHHGTLLIKYFYHKAIEKYGEENVQEETYRYPGPKPQTKEAAILMMADAVEAAVRSLRERTPSRVQNMVHTLIHDRLMDGQFDECDLTLRDLDRIEAALLPVLAGTLHERIEYPKDSRVKKRIVDTVPEMASAPEDDRRQPKLPDEFDRESDDAGRDVYT